MGSPSGVVASPSVVASGRAAFGNAFFTSTAELGLRFNQQLYVNAFYDAGNNYARVTDFNPSRLFRGAGFGLSVITPLGPLGLDWAYVHEEACRWEHVMSEQVERRLVELLGHPTESPYGNPIPGLAELGEVHPGEQFRDGVESLTAAVGTESRRVRVRRISEEMQKDETLMGALRRAGAIPGAVIAAVSTQEGVLLGSSGETAEIVPEAADHIFVTPA